MAPPVRAVSLTARESPGARDFVTPHLVRTARHGACRGGMGALEPLPMSSRRDGLRSQGIGRVQDHDANGSWVVGEQRIGCRVGLPAKPAVEHRLPRPIRVGAEEQRHRRP